MRRSPLHGRELCGVFGRNIRNQKYWFVRLFIQWASGFGCINGTFQESQTSSCDVMQRSSKYMVVSGTSMVALFQTFRALAATIGYLSSLATQNGTRQLILSLLLWDGGCLWFGSASWRSRQRFPKSFENSSRTPGPISSQLPTF